MSLVHPHFLRNIIEERMCRLLALIKSEITGKTYDLDYLNSGKSALYLSTCNMLQCFCYLYLGCQRALLDIVCGENQEAHRMYFIWDKTNEDFKKAHDKWCLRTWENEE